MSSSSPTPVNLEQQRKRAKDLRRAHAGGGLEAAVRVARHLPRARHQSPPDVLASALTLSEAQFVVAREAGFASWPDMKRHGDAARRAAGDVEAIIDAAFDGDDAAVRAALEHGPATARQSLHLAAALADVDAVAAALDTDPSLADRRGGRRAWPPLLYLCFSRYRRREPDATAARLDIARRLIAAGADVNRKGAETGLPSFNVTLFDQEEWHPLEAAAGRLASADLVRLLIDAGADLVTAPIVLSQAVSGGDLNVLQHLLPAAPRHWFAVRWALKACVILDRIDMARMIVAATGGDDPTQASPDQALLEAIRLERGRDWIEILLARDDTPEATMSMRQAAYRAAIRHGHGAAAGILLQHGAKDAAIGPVDRVIGGCMTGDRATVEQYVRDPREFRNTLRVDDHRMLAWAVRRGRHEAISRLLDVGLDPNIADKDGDTPLHLAVRAASVDSIERLLRAGAVVDARNFDDQTALDLALVHPDRGARERLTRRLVEAGADPGSERQDLSALFERAADAVVAGELETLGRFLDEEPALVHARSPRPHRATLLHYAVANGVEQPRQRMPPNAPAITRLLLERGADANATCNLYGGGWAALGLLITSTIPRTVGLDGEMVRALARGGAKVDTDDLIHCIVHDMPRATQALVEAGVPVDSLFTAAGLGRTGTIEDLLARGDDINSRYEGASTPLHAAATGGHTDAVRLLLRRGADVTLRNVWGGTAAGTARYFGRPETAELIEQHRPLP